MGVRKKRLPKDAWEVCYLASRDGKKKKKTTAVFRLSIRTWRGLRYNEDYALKLERKFSRERPHGTAQSELDAHGKHQAVNPFAVRPSELAIRNVNPLH